MPTTLAGFFTSTRDSLAARENSASAEIASPGAITPPRYSPLADDHVEGSGRAEIDHDAGATVAREGRDAIDQAVSAQLGRIIDQDGHAGLDAGFHKHGLQVEVALAYLAQSGLERAAPPKR